MIPADIKLKTRQFSAVETALHSLFGVNAGISGRKFLTRGKGTAAYKLTLESGKEVFLKTAPPERASIFLEEAAGLEAIAETETVSTPRLFCTGCGNEYSFLMTEFMKGKTQAADYWEVFAHRLAAMHQTDTKGLVPGGRYGFSHDNHIGATAQINTPYASWIDFFRECRLKPQFQLAMNYFKKEEQEQIPKLLNRLGDILTEPEFPSLLHGDLWCGNVITGNDGQAWMIDPAAYVGHAEADIAMTELFGGFPRKFYDAYRKVMPMQPGYSKRRGLYNLYHLLNHLNLFGSSYLAEVKYLMGEYIR
ncbi:fructosamine kinase [Petralouisia muris]|uniref:Fructosamine kinase n=1 Tax=Petralouisia muris TaxID=3032872 RepID=A0AC61S1N1_9FIRM|nr:fructosamine kinase family protein [Petralouisia muris]TGY98330.1 fructosamine kinase [Petralouisia muris]